jgi:hypothetical protein
MVLMLFMTLDLVQAGLRVLGCVEPGFGLGLDLDVGLDLAFWFGPSFGLCGVFCLFSCYVIACIPTCCQNCVIVIGILPAKYNFFRYFPI